MKDNSDIIEPNYWPTILKNIEKYLVSIKNIGQLTANRIVYRGGIKTLEIIRIDIGSLGKIKGVGPKKQWAIWKAVRDEYSN